MALKFYLKKKFVENIDSFIPAQVLFHTCKKIRNMFEMSFDVKYTCKLEGQRHE